MFTQKFKALPKLVEMSAKWKERVKSLGFGHFLSLLSLKLPRDLLVVILQGYDPPTQELGIRGITKKISVTNVKDLFRLPCSGKEVSWDIKEDDLSYRMLKSKFQETKFVDVLGLIKGCEGRAWVWFSIYNVHTWDFLCPFASPEVTCVVKVVHNTSEGVDQYEWAAYIWKEFHREMTRYTDYLKKRKSGKCYVEGCFLSYF